MISTMVLDIIENEFEKPPPEFTYYDMSDKELKFLESECNKKSEFDPLNKRKELYDKFIKNNTYNIFVECKYGKIFGIFENETQIVETPFILWMRILRIYSEKIIKPFKVYFLAVNNLREFPEGNKPIKPENINGGYTYSCNHETIMIYRAEDATRVLIHELLHSSCTDKLDSNVDLIESETEAWAELVYIALLSQGRKFIFNDLLKRQSEWMRKQNAKVRKHMTNPESKEFPWRYTIGKQDVWERWGILSKEDMKPYINKINTLRLTYPVDNSIKIRFGVSITSTIL
jgi:hypothetical protein